MRTEKLVQYWKASLLDVDMASLDLRNIPHSPVSTQDLQSGCLPKGTFSTLFPDSKDSTEEIDKREDAVSYKRIVVAPIILGRADSQGRPNRFTRPLLPLLIPAGLDIHGNIIHGEDYSSPWIPREFLEPAVGDLVLGDVNKMEKYLNLNPPSPGEDLQENWRRIFTYSMEMLDDVSDGQWQDAVTEAGFVADEPAQVINSELIGGMSRNILNVYGPLLKEKQFPGLLKTMAKDSAGPVREALNVDQWSEVASKHLGSFHTEYPLAPSQRKALHHILSTQSGEICAISGPPGTGKTTLLHSIIASLWVQAALERADPPVIVVSSTNNQAVTNVLDSLHSFESIDRWLPIDNFGLYLVNDPKRQAAAAEKNILYVDKKGGGFPTTIENSSAVIEFKERYLEKCSQYFDRPIRQIDIAVDALQRKLSATADNLRTGISTAYSLKLFLDTVGDKSHLDKRIAELECERKEKADSLDTAKQLRLAWIDHCQHEPFIYGLLSFTSAVRRRRENRTQQFLLNHLANEQIKPDIDQVEAFIDEQFSASLREVQDASKRREELENTRRKLGDLEQKWSKWRQKNQAVDLELSNLTKLEQADGEAESKCLHNWLDTHSRYELLVLAVRYWEGRWLQEATAIEAKNGDYQRPGDLLSQEARFRRYAMLTPCFIATMHSGPSFFNYYRGEPIPLFDYIDWLIVDEAGQVSPEVAGAMFSLSKRAIVVGDEKQIEPVWSVPEKIDRNNLERIGLAKTDAAYSSLLDKGMTASSGSVMRISRHASLVGEINQLAPASPVRGLILTEHRRCVPQVITYCNELAYGGLLQPRRKPIKDYPWPHMGYVHIRGECQRRGGSRYNEREAQAIVTWLKENWQQLTAYYGSAIGDIVGIVTPFAAQKRLIQPLLKGGDFASILAGTVHAFQGAERRLMLFSPVYTSSESGTYFFDRNVNMLNVAVSRAKDAFIVIGDMDIFDRSLRSPSGLLAKHLFANESNELTLSDLPFRQDTDESDDVHIVDTLALHRKTLQRAFERAEEQLIIVSPFLRSRAVEADGIPDLTSQAVKRGVAVTVYTDLSFNDGMDLPSAKQAQKLLAAAGAIVLVCDNIHSKLICIDDSIFIEGSFNWLSAERHIEIFVRHDTSIIYMGEHAANFISSTLSDITSRVIEQPIPH
jgi:hypothetical protein